MRRFLGVAILVGAGACDAASAQPPPAPAATVTVPTELSAAPAWIGRNFDTGLIAREHTHVTQTLRRHGIRALLTIETRVAQGTMFEIGPWKPATVKTYLGTAKDAKRVVTLDLINIADATDTISMPCRKTTIAAATATAVRRATVSATECGDDGRFHPRTTKRLSVLRCLPFDDKRFDLDDSATWSSADHLAFAASPGIEWLYVNDDCLQGGGWRQVPADGAIVAQVRYEPTPAKPRKPSKLPPPRAR